MRRILGSILMLFVVAGCSQEPAQMPKGTADAVKPTNFNTAGAPTVVFNAPDMMCPEGCGAKVKEILSGQPGAKEVVVDFGAKTATVAIDKDAKFDSSAAVAALADHGFKNSSVKSGAATDSQPSAAPADNSDKAKTGGAG
jgi:copper chaperone CopZ